MTVVLDNLTILKEIVVDNSFKATLYDNGIVEIAWDDAVEIIETMHLIQIKQVLLVMGGGKKMPLYFSIPDFLHISDDAQKLAATEENGKYTLANAVLINNLAKKIVFNFFMLIFKPTTRTKGFSNQEDAFEWLEKLLLDYEMSQI